MDAIPLRKVNKSEVISFLEKHIITKFGIPDSLVLDNASYFSSLKLTPYALQKRIKIKFSSNYYSNGNVVAELSNKNLIRILTKIVVELQKNWHNALTNDLRVDRVTPKFYLGNSPYFLVYG